MLLNRVSGEIKLLKKRKMAGRRRSILLERAEECSSLEQELALKLEEKMSEERALKGILQQGVKIECLGNTDDLDDVNSVECLTFRLEASPDTRSWRYNSRTCQSPVLEFYSEDIPHDTKNESDEVEIFSFTREVVPAELGAVDPPVIEKNTVVLSSASQRTLVEKRATPTNVIKPRKKRTKLSQLSKLH